MRRRFLALAILAVPACAGQGTSEPPAPVNVPPQPSTIAPMAKVEPSSSATPSPSVVASAAPSSSASQVAAPVGPFVSTTRLISWIYEKPKTDAPHAGYLRVGGKVVRTDAPAEATGCNGGKWYAVQPAGFVCEGHEGVTTKMDDPSVMAGAQFPPDTSSPFPYGPGTSYGSPLYTRIPTAAEQKAAEGDVAAHTANVAAMRAKMEPSKLPPLLAMPLGPVPSFLADHAQAPNVVGWTIPKAASTAGYAWANMRLSFLSAFEQEGRAFYLTTEHFIVPADRMRAARLADFHGIELAREGEPGEHLPIAWVRWKPAHLFKMGASGDSFTDTGELIPFQTHLSIAVKERTIAGTRFLELREPPPGVKAEAGVVYLARVTEATRVDQAAELPFNVAANDTWIEVSIGRQSLTLYQGLRPVFTTLVSTGVDGVDDVQTTRSTPRGAFRIHSKHWSYRMAADEHPPWKDGDKPDPRYRIDDVPYVQYFHAGYALHAAYWHDSFGQPKSHGCINLSPRDALWLFTRTLPLVPQGWHGVYGGRGNAAMGSYLIVRAW